MAASDVEYRCFVGGLAWSTDDRSLADAFRSFGEIIDSKVVSDRETGRSRGFGFVTFAEEQSMFDAIEAMNGTELDGRNITVNQAQSRSGTSGGGYRGSGGGGSGGGTYGRYRYGDRGEHGGYGGSSDGRGYSNDRGYGGSRGDSYSNERGYVSRSGGGYSNDRSYGGSLGGGVGGGAGSSTWRK